jgi:hypothetical protein
MQLTPELAHLCDFGIDDIVVYLLLMKPSLKDIKSRLGLIQFLDFTYYDLAHAHRELGKQVREQVWRILDRRIADIKPERLTIKINQAKECWNSLQDRAKHQRVAEILRVAICDYIICLEAWADGLDLIKYSHPALKNLTSFGNLLTPPELALLLQDDNVGCQTGMYRYTSGGVQLWHTEEDVDRRSGSRFDCLRVASFRVGSGKGGERFHTFIYPDLMPGPAFSWRDDGYVQAVDTLLINNPQPISDGMFANIVCWLAVRVGLSVNTDDMLELLHPFIDGYAMNMIWLDNQTVRAARYEFAGNQVIKSSLDDEPGSFLFQVNYFSDRTDATLRAMEALSPRSERVMSERIDRTAQALQNPDAFANDAGFQMRYFYRLLTSREGREWAYANKDVKAHFLCQVEPDEMEIWLGAGPAGREDVPLKITLEF